MSLGTNLALPTTLPDLLKARDDALRLIADARRLTEMAEEALGPYGRALMPSGAKLAEDDKRIRAEMDSRMWRRAFDLTGLRQLMDEQAVTEFEKSLCPAPPEFTMDNIRATFIELHQGAEDMFRRGVFNVFRWLSDSYRTNEKEPFRIGRKVVMTCMVGLAMRTGLSIRYDRAASKLNDIDRVIQTLDGKRFEPRTLEVAMNVAFAKREVFENDYFRAKAFRNGNLHLEFKRLDLLDKVNEEIAAYYGDGALPDACNA